MRIFHRIDALPEELKPNAIAFGKFDGVHLGHRAILDHLARQARADAMPSVVLTFENNPLTLLDPEHAPADVVSPAQKLELIAQSDVDATIITPFDERFAHIPAERFVRHMLAERLGVRHVFVGRDFRFGEGGSGGESQLAAIGAAAGIEVHILPDVGFAGQGRISASRVRELLTTGEVAEASLLLDRLHAVRGLVVQGDQRGRELGYPTANLEDRPEGLVPGDGVYAGWLVARGERMPAAISIGTNPTFTGVLNRRIEAHVLDRTVDLYGERVVVEFVDRIRGMTAFGSMDELVTAIAADVDSTRRILARA